MSAARCRRAGFALAALLLAAAAPATRAQVLQPSTPIGAARLTRAGGALAADHALAVRYDGTLEFEGHFARPHATRTYHSTRRITVAGPDRARQDWTTWEDGDSARTVESTLLLGTRVLHRDDEHAPWIELAGREAGEAAWTVWSAVPALMAARGVERLGHGLMGGPLTASRSRFDWPEPLGVATVDLDVVDLPFQMQVVLNDPRRGVLAPDSRYFGTTQQAGLVWPDSLSSMCYPVGASWHLYERRVSIDEHAPLSALAEPDSVRPATPARTDTLAVVALLAPHVWAVDLPDADTRSLALEFADHLVVLESGCDVPHGERLKAAIAKVSRKPVRFVSFSHHHPDYTGGLRPFIADTATVVCAGSNKEYVNEIAHWSFAPDPDRLWKRRPGGTTPLVDTLVAGRWRHADAMNEVVAIDMGGQSHHTDAYLVFWLPRAKLLFEGDLGWFASNGTVRASSRAEGLLQAIDGAKLAPATVTQGWTPNGTPRSIPMRKLRELVAARSHP